MILPLILGLVAAAFAVGCQPQKPKNPDPKPIPIDPVDGEPLDSSSSKIAVSISQCYEETSIPIGPGCIIHSEDAYYDASDLITQVDGTPVGGTKSREKIESYLQNRLGLNSLYAVKLENMAAYLENISSARNAVEQKNYRKALDYIMNITPLNLSEGNIDNPVTQAAVRNIAKAAITPHMQMGEQVLREQNSDYKTVSNLLSGSLFFGYSQIKYLRPRGIFEPSDLSAIDRLRPKLLSIAFRVVSDEAERLLQTQNPSDRALVAIWHELRNMGLDAQEMGVRISRSKLVNLQMKIEKTVPPDSPERSF